MTPQGLLSTALLLGLYVLFAGGYALAYAWARFEGRHKVKGVSVTFFIAHCAVVAVIVVASALAPGWKLLLIASSIAIFAIPPFTWRYLERLHGPERTS